MEQSLALEFAKKFQISTDRVLREEWELTVLDRLSRCSFSNILVLYGGTALRLAYSSVRFSDDLDFFILKRSDEKEFYSEIKKNFNNVPFLKISDLWSKYYTYLAEFKIKESWYNIPISIKVEISKRQIKNKTKNYELKLLSSPVTNIQVLFNVATIKKIYQDKIKAVKERNYPRDLFDLWFTCQKLNIPYNPQDAKLDKKILVRELRKYLPANFYPVIKELQQ